MSTARRILEIRGLIGGATNAQPEPPTHGGTVGPAAGTGPQSSGIYAQAGGFHSDLPEPLEFDWEGEPAAPQQPTRPPSGTAGTGGPIRPQAGPPTASSPGRPWSDPAAVAGAMRPLAYPSAGPGQAQEWPRPTADPRPNREWSDPRPSPTATVPALVPAPPQPMPGQADPWSENPRWALGGNRFLPEVPLPASWDTGPPASRFEAEERAQDVRLRSLAAGAEAARQALARADWDLRQQRRKEEPRMLLRAGCAAGEAMLVGLAVGAIEKTVKSEVPPLLRLSTLVLGAVHGLDEGARLLQEHLPQDTDPTDLVASRPSLSEILIARTQGLDGLAYEAGWQAEWTRHASGSPDEGCGAWDVRVGPVAVKWKK